MRKFLAAILLTVFVGVPAAHAWGPGYRGHSDGCRRDYGCCGRGYSRRDWYRHEQRWDHRYREDYGPRYYDYGRYDEEEYYDNDSQYYAPPEAYNPGIEYGHDDSGRPYVRSR